MPRTSDRDGELAERRRQGATLKQMRDLRGVTVNELSNAMGISYAYLSNIEAGRKRLTAPLLAKAARALDIRPGSLVSPELFPDMYEPSSVPA